MLLRGEHEDDNACMMFYGTDNGILGQLFLGRSGGYPGWTLTNVRKLGGINSIGAASPSCHAWGLQGAECVRCSVV